MQHRLDQDSDLILQLIRGFESVVISPINTYVFLLYFNQSSSKFFLSISSLPSLSWVCACDLVCNRFLAHGWRLRHQGDQLLLGFLVEDFSSTSGLRWLAPTIVMMTTMTSFYYHNELNLSTTLLRLLVSMTSKLTLHTTTLVGRMDLQHLVGCSVVAT